MMEATGLQSTEDALALKRIEQHPRFLEAVELAREEKRTFGSDAFNDAIYEIQSEIANDVLKDFYEAKVVPPNYP